MAGLALPKTITHPFHVRVEGLLFLAALLLIGSHYGNDYQNWQWCLGLSMALFVPKWELYPAKFCLLTVALFYFLAQSLYTSYLVLSLDKNILLLVMAWIAVFSFLSAGQLGRWFNANCSLAAIGYFGLINALYVIARMIAGVPMLGGRQNGFLDYVGLNGSLIALSWPFLMESSKSLLERVLVTAVILLALWFTAANIPYAVLIAVVSSYIIFKYKKFAVAGLSGIAISSLVFIQGFRTLSGFDRLGAYKVFMKYWSQHFSWTFGAGSGSFRMLSGYIQSETGFQTKVLSGGTETAMNWWPWLHSDWLQCLFEFGAVGLLLATLVYFSSLTKLYRKEQYACLSMLIGIGVTALGDYPLRYFVFELLAAIAVSRAYSEDTCLQ